MCPMPFPSHANRQTYVVESDMFKDTHGKPTVGVCLWGGENFYSIADVGAHNTDGMPPARDSTNSKRGR
jgi:hypothetical protein